MVFREIKDVLFDTSFLLNNSPRIDEIIEILRRDKLSCYISPAVRSELEYLYYTGRITKERIDRATARYRKAKAVNIETHRKPLQYILTRECTLSMNREHGVEPKEVRNDCNILTSSLYGHIDLILSEDFHFTSKYTDRVVDTVCSKTCDRYRKLCDCDILLLNKDTFLAAYRGKSVDLDIVEAGKKRIRKDSKVLKGNY